MSNLFEFTHFHREGKARINLYLSQEVGCWMVVSRYYGWSSGQITAHPDNIDVAAFPKPDYAEAKQAFMEACECFEDDDTIRGEG